MEPLLLKVFKWNGMIDVRQGDSSPSKRFQSLKHATAFECPPACCPQWLSSILKNLENWTNLEINGGEGESPLILTFSKRFNWRHSMNPVR